MQAEVEHGAWIGSLQEDRSNVFMGEKRIAFEQIHDGEWFQPKPQRGHLMACCDCGLVHRMDFRIKGGKVQLRAVRDKKRTAARRRTVRVK